MTIEAPRSTHRAGVRRPPSAAGADLLCGMGREGEGLSGETKPIRCPATSSRGQLVGNKPNSGDFRRDSGLVLPNKPNFRRVRCPGHATIPSFRHSMSRRTKPISILCRSGDRRSRGSSVRNKANRGGAGFQGAVGCTNKANFHRCAGQESAFAGVRRAKQSQFDPGYSVHKCLA